MCLWRPSTMWMCECQGVGLWQRWLCECVNVMVWDSDGDDHVSMWAYEFQGMGLWQWWPCERMNVRMRDSDGDDRVSVWISGYGTLTAMTVWAHKCQGVGLWWRWPCDHVNVMVWTLDIDLYLYECHNIDPCECEGMGLRKHTRCDFFSMWHTPSPSVAATMLFLSVCVHPLPVWYEFFLWSIVHSPLQCSCQGMNFSMYLCLQFLLRLTMYHRSWKEFIPTPLQEMGDGMKFA